MLLTESTNLLTTLRAFKAADSACRKVFCSTCGGQGRAVLQGLTPALRKEIDETLSKMPLADLHEFGEWQKILDSISPLAVEAVYLRAGQTLDPTNVRDLDRFLFTSKDRAGQSSELQALHQSALDRGITLAVETGDESLIETLILALGEHTVDHKDLLDAALARQNNPQIARALYNKLRKLVPAVRSIPIEEISAQALAEQRAKDTPEQRMKRFLGE